jgi:dTDP-4-amino-4,6-dideoxy-D-galactose acyltransferase
MADADLCRLLDWDSEFFGRRIAQVSGHRLDAALADDILAWAKRHAVECLYFLADADDPATGRVAEERGFRQVDVRVTLERRLDGLLAPADDASHGLVRPAVANDRPALRALARVSHRDSRFYHDPGFPAARCDDLYETWIDKSVSGYAERVLVVDHDETAVGYVSCHFSDADNASIGLFAVSPAHQGRGAGRALLAAALRWFAEHGRRRVTVVTQGRNARAQRLYEGGGFTRHAVQLWYHRWLE